MDSLENTKTIKPIAKRGLSRKTRQTLVGWFFMMPALFLFLCFVLLPVIVAIVTSFADYNGIDFPTEWKIDNYTEVLFGQDVFYFKRALGNLMLYIVIYVPLNILLSMFIAILVANKSKSMRAFRVAYYLPVLVSGIAVGLVWNWMLNPNIGVINNALRAIGIKNPPNWINNPNITMLTVAIVSLWSGTATNTVLYVAAIQGISESLYEAARIEGAGPLTMTFRITIPLLLPITVFVMTTVFISAFQLYDAVLMIFGDQGNPALSSLVPIMSINKAVSNGARFGRASAMSVLLLIIITFVTFGSQFITKLLAKDDNLI